MVVDSSAVIAILRQEPGWEELQEALVGAEVAVMSAAAVVETSIVIEAASGELGLEKLDALLDAAGIAVVAFEPEQVALAREGFRRFGKGRHPAGLNFGDCLCYALARQRAEPLLFKGGDFSKTDVETALRAI
jgi:ribonuclease VapC